MSLTELAKILSALTAIDGIGDIEANVNVDAMGNLTEFSGNKVSFRVYSTPPTDPRQTIGQAELAEQVGRQCESCLLIHAEQRQLRSENRTRAKESRSVIDPGD